MTTSLCALLRQYRILLGPERQVQEALSQVFEKLGIQFRREHILGPNDRIDFLLDCGVGVEVKCEGWSPMRIYRQLERYAEFEDVARIVLVTGQAISLPSSIKGKPAEVFSLGRSWL